MSNHNECFNGDRKKNALWIPLLPRVMQALLKMGPQRKGPD